jgi:AraC-like DNA-binding protein
MSMRFSTAAVDRRSQLSYWHEVVCATFVRLAVERLDRSDGGLRAEVIAHRLGDLQVASIVSEPHAVYRSARMIRSWPEDDVLVDLAVSGRAVVAQDGTQVVLNPGDFTVYTSTRPYRVACPDPFRLLVLQVPRDVFVAHCPPPHATPVTVRGDRGAGAVFSALCRALPAELDALDPDAARQLGGNVLDLLGTVLSGGTARALPHRAQLARAQRYMTDHLADPALSPGSVSDALGMSVRYLHLLFQAEGSTPYRWLVEHRLDRAAALLADSRQASRTISEIAAGTGFKDAAHFSRVFRDRHGLSPSEYRASGIAG